MVGDTLKESISVVIDDTPTLPVTKCSAHIPCVFRIHKEYKKKKKGKKQRFEGC